jgi:LacI family transcriptional regulator
MSTVASSLTDGSADNAVRAGGTMSDMHDPIVKADGRRPRSSMREVAEAAGVAMSSVSRVLSDHPDVSPAMRQRVRAAVEELGYEPNLLAQSLRRQETLSVGFVVRDISNPLMAEIVKSAEKRLRESGYALLLTNSESDPELDADHIRLFQQRRVDGLILSLTSETHPRTTRLLEQLGVPCVLVDRDVPASVQASRVLYDHQPGVRAAVGHLLDLGHRRIDLILGAPVRPSRERRAGFEAEFAARALPKSYRIVEAGEFVAEPSEVAVAQLLDAADPPTAIVVGSNQMLPGAVRALAERDLELPRDLSLVSCDDIALAELYRPPIAVVRHDNSEVGRLAAELLVEAMRAKDSPPRDIVLTPEFLVRGSCGPPGPSSR